MQVDQESGEILELESRGGGGGGGGGGGRAPGGGADDGAMPELYGIYKAEVAKLEGFGAFCRIDGFRKQGLLCVRLVRTAATHTPRDVACSVLHA